MEEDQSKKNGESIARIEGQLIYIRDRIDEFVTKAEFRVVRAVVFGMVSVILTAFIIALVSNVMQQHH